MTYVGIDNGISGGVVVLNEDGDIIFKATMPTTLSPDKKNIIDARVLCQYLRPYVGALVTAEGQIFSQQANTIKSMADSRATIRTVCKLLGMAYKEVAPKEWQKTYWKRPANAKATGWTTKKAGQAEVKRLGKDKWLYESERSKTLHDGLVDAYLIAEWRRRETRPFLCEEEVEGR